MGHIFLSYAREDLNRARTIAAALDQAGFPVWWDRQIAGGSEYSREIEQALKSASAVLVLWSRHSVDSPWVRDEAAKGRDSGRLVPATLDGTEPPLGFGQFHTIDLQGQLRRRSRGIEEVIAAIGRKGDPDTPQGGSGEPARAVARASPRPGRSLRAAVAGALGLAAVGAGAIYLFNAGSLTEPSDAAGDGGTVAISRFEAVSPDGDTQRVARLAGDAVERTFATNFIETLTVRSAGPDALRDADFVLNGTVDRQAGDLIASASILEPKGGRTLWSTERRRSADEGRQLADELAIWVADVLRCAFYARSKMQEYRTGDVESRIFRWCETERSRGEQFDQMPAVAKELVEAAPKSGQAHAYLALGLSLAYPERGDDIRSAADTALKLDPDNGVARVALAATPGRGVTLAERESLYREAMRLDPGFMYSRAQLAFLVMTLGRTEEATSLLGELVSDYPLDYFQRGFWAFLLAEGGNIRQAREEFARIEELRPGFRIGTRSAIESEILFGDPVSARPWIERWNPADADRKCVEFVIGARIGNRSPSPRDISAACGERGLFAPALLNGLFGNVDEVYKRMDEGFATASAIPRFGPRFLYYPGLEAVRSDSRFMPLMARFGYARYWLETGNWPDFCREDKLPYRCEQAARDAVAGLAGKRSP